ncbi:pectate lyase family protein [Xylanibacter caecicola]|uniref:pectate lyase family protein n=1 Tax=Xylanibacter caecicola TaxID=2736294 RepID=UPI003DA609C8
MKNKLITAVILFMGMIMPYMVMAQTPAFPGAEGFGMYTTGGRGGAVYHVTTLEDNSNPGSFRYACTRSDKRTIVFDVSGTIQLKSELKMNRGNVTIAGQTAPGDGICIAGYPFTIAADNVIIRFVRFRLGNTNVANHEGDGLGGMDRKNIIVDHCSVSWSIDECLSVYGSKDITVQWCIASQSLKNAGHSKGSHGYGGNWGGSGASYHHNLMAHHESRVPRLGPRPGTQADERMDLRNNVFYNWAGNGCYGGEGMNVNIVNNYYKPGPATRKRSSSIQQRLAAPGIRTVDYCLNKKTTVSRYNSAAGTSFTDKHVSGSHSNGKNYIAFNGTKYEIDMTTNTINVNGKTVTVTWNEWKPMLHTWGKFYVEGNYNPAFPAMNADNFKYGVSNQIDKTGNDGTYPGDNEVKITTPVEYTNVTTHSAEDAYERVLTYAGASLHRDWIDDLMVSDTRNNVATYTGSGNYPGIINSQDDNKPANADANWSAWPTLNSETAPADTDGDGMPDAWEEANGLNKNDANDGKIVGEDGYTNLERYMNSLVSHIMEGGNEGGTLLNGQQIFGDPTGISDITVAKKDDNRIYNLQGIEVQNPTKRGIYIRNGKKFVINR